MLKKQIYYFFFKWRFCLGFFLALKAKWLKNASNKRSDTTNRDLPALPRTKFLLFVAFVLDSDDLCLGKFVSASFWDFLAAFEIINVHIIILGFHMCGRETIKTLPSCRKSNSLNHIRKKTFIEPSQSQYAPGTVGSKKNNNYENEWRLKLKCTQHSCHMMRIFVTGRA